MPVQTIQTDSPPSVVPSRDWLKLTLMTLAFFAVIGSHYLLKSYTGPLIVRAFGARRIPWIGVAEAALSLTVLALILSTPLLRVRLSAVVAGMLFVASISMVCFPLVSPNRASLIALQLAGSAALSCAGYALWTLFVAALVTRSWLYMAVFGAGAQCGMLLSTWVAPAFARWGHLEYVPVIAGLGYLFAMGLLGFGLRRFPCFGAAAPRTVAPSAVRAVPWRAITASLSSFYILSLIGLIILQIAFGDALRWKVYARLEHLPGQQQAIDALAAFFRYSAAFCLVAQLLVVPCVMRFLTPRWGLAILPILAGVAVTAVQHEAVVAVVPAVIAAYVSIDYTVNNCVRESLFIPMSLSEKIHTKAVLSLVVPRLGGAVGSGMVLLGEYFYTGLWGFVAYCICVAWLVFALIAASQYAKRARRPLQDAVPCLDTAAERVL